MQDMRKQVDALFQSLAHAMVERDPQGLVASLSTPYVVYLLDEILVAHTSEELLEFVQLRLSTAMTPDVAHVRVKVIEVHEDGEGRATVLTQWDFLTVAGKIVTSNLIRNMVSRAKDGPGLRIEIAEFLWLSDVPLAENAIETLRVKQPAWLKPQ